MLKMLFFLTKLGSLWCTRHGLIFCFPDPQQPRMMSYHITGPHGVTPWKDNRSLSQILAGSGTSLFPHRHFVNHRKPSRLSNAPVQRLQDFIGTHEERVIKWVSLTCIWRVTWSLTVFLRLFSGCPMEWIKRLRRKRSLTHLSEPHMLKDLNLGDPAKVISLNNDWQNVL